MNFFERILWEIPIKSHCIQSFLSLIPSKATGLKKILLLLYHTLIKEEEDLSYRRDTEKLIGLWKIKLLQSNFTTNLPKLLLPWISLKADNILLNGLTLSITGWILCFSTNFIISKNSLSLPMVVPWRVS